MPGVRSDRSVVALILLPGAVGRGAKGPACLGFVCLVNRSSREERHGRAETVGCGGEEAV